MVGVHVSTTDCAQGKLPPSNGDKCNFLYMESSSRSPLDQVSFAPSVIRNHFLKGYIGKSKMLTASLTNIVGFENYVISSEYSFAYCQSFYLPQSRLKDRRCKVKLTCRSNQRVRLCLLMCTIVTT